MNDFMSFARECGLIIEHLFVGAWRRVPTVDHPRKRNGAYKLMTDIGWVQNHATMDHVAVWRPDKADQIVIDPARAKRAADAEGRRIAEARTKAAQRAQELVKAATLAPHPYLAAKGFPELHGLVTDTANGPRLVVPMYCGSSIVGAQLIDDAGDKKFLPGQQSKGATFTIGRGTPVWCEGYATALSVNAALRAARMNMSVVACFSAFNLQHLAKAGAVIADNDESMTGERAAKATGLRYWMSDQVGEDFNDYARRVGAFRAAMALKTTLALGAHKYGRLWNDGG